jgi:predicted neutral ceramidase superfamily lipid hydrolase
MSNAEIPRDVQRFILAIILICGFFGVFAYVFYVTKDVEIAKTVLTVLAGALSSIIAFFYGSKSAEVRSVRT